MHRKVKIKINFKKFLSASIPEASTSIHHQSYELEDIHKKYGGFPNSYVFENTRIHQKFWNKDECDFNELGNLLNMNVITVSTIMQPPGNTIPLHRDTFYKIKQQFPDNNLTVVRANIYLEDWKTGHFLQYDDVVDTHWKQGDGHMWDSEVLHIGANNGMENKYTLQVSGFLI